MCSRYGRNVDFQRGQLTFNPPELFLNRTNAYQEEIRLVNSITLRLQSWRNSEYFVFMSSVPLLQGNDITNLNREVVFRCSSISRRIYYVYWNGKFVLYARRKRRERIQEIYISKREVLLV